MYRFRFEVMLAALAVIVCAGAVGLWFEVILELLEKTSSQQTTYVTLCVLCSAILAGVTAGLRRQLPNYGGMPPVQDLLRFLRPIISAGVTACLAIAWASVLLEAIPESSKFARTVLLAAQSLDIGLLITCIGIAISVVVDFRRACEWERRSHPHQYPQGKF